MVIAISDAFKGTVEIFRTQMVTNGKIWKIFKELFY